MAESRVFLCGKSRFKRAVQPAAGTGFRAGKEKDMNSISQIFAVAAYKARIAKGLSQEKAAELAGISTGWYQCIEKGEVNASLAICVRIAIVLGVDLNKLMLQAAARG